MDLQQMGCAARSASYQLAEASTQTKNAALMAMAEALEANAEAILAANAKDLDAARDNGIGEAMLDRLMLNPARLKAIADDVRNVVRLPDPVGAELESRVLENGMRLSRRRVPLGVVGVIYEARPNVTIDIAALCLKTGNASILRGGRETFHTNQELVKVIRLALAACELSESCVQYIGEPGREWVSGLLKLDQYVDMIIPRGGPGLHQLCKEQATIPVIIGGFGISHTYVDDSADLTRAIEVIDNAKTHRPSACNALDTLLVHEAVADELLPALSARMAEKGVQLVACEHSLPLLKDGPADVRAAGDNDFDTEWLSLTLGVRLVIDVEAALSHLRTFNASHSDAILTNSLVNAERFVNGAPSAAVYVNASTRFTDGAQFGLGAEVAVSTQKLHARGPMGLEELTSYKWVGLADYLIRQ
ncbi:glutamate-5-semialdehyde dehydrogenase [Oceanimonas baumannii]|uniref:Gamma-glutamyl phosphate reductase n=1 Tax=Oceanimonas baumannii TaxID=129578 RepID=A0A235CPI0_9GAMM|nr:glutamate-5-semialdehyde dehydrogenase [Oceanimonas baumannii]OYD26339.1 glutamate-5-semialdehyde dehydrogenase [Oceanimonas baumannii]TDW62002.1 glutamate-5-semialdehyde dehydrogenase [Oceanimonas baumannii]